MTAAHFHPNGTDEDHPDIRHRAAELVKLTREAKERLHQWELLIERISEAALLLPSLTEAAQGKQLSEASNRLLGLQEVADRLGVSTVTLMKMRKAGQVPEPIHISERRRMYREADIEQWLRQGGAPLADRARRISDRD